VGDPLLPAEGRDGEPRTVDATKEGAVPDGKPNILVIWGDHIGIANLSCYTHG